MFTHIRVACGDNKISANFYVFWQWICNLANCCIFTNLIISYLDSSISNLSIYKIRSFVIGYPIITIISVINLVDLDCVLIINNSASIIVFLSCVGFIIIGLSNIDSSSISEIDYNANLNDYMMTFSWIIWINSGVLFFNNTNTVKTHKMFSFIWGLLILLAFIINVLMIWIILSIDDNKHHYSNSNGYFAQIHISCIISQSCYKYLFQIIAIICLIERYQNRLKLQKHIIYLIETNLQDFIPRKNHFGTLDSLLSYGNVQENYNVQRLNVDEENESTIPEPKYRHQGFSVLTSTTTQTTPEFDATPITPPSQQAILFTNRIMNTVNKTGVTPISDNKISSPITLNITELQSPDTETESLKSMNLSASKCEFKKSSSVHLLSSNASHSQISPSKASTYVYNKCCSFIQRALYYKNITYGLLNYLIILILYSID